MNKNRIIGDFLEINSDIVQAEFESKLPKFLKKFKFKKQRKRLLDNLTKLRESNTVLEADNIIELFSYIYNNYPDDFSYKAINKCTVNLEEESYEGLIKFDNQLSIITIYRDEYPRFNINSKITLSEGISEGIDIQIDKLWSDNEKKNDILFKVNRVLLDTICDYIEDIIKVYYDNKETKDELVEESILGINVES